MSFCHCNESRSPHLVPFCPIGLPLQPTFDQLRRPPGSDSGAESPAPVGTKFTFDLPQLGTSPEGCCIATDVQGTGRSPEPGERTPCNCRCVDSRAGDFWPITTHLCLPAQPAGTDRVRPTAQFLSPSQRRDDELPTFESRQWPHAGTKTPHRVHALWFTGASGRGPRGRDSSTATGWNDLASRA